MPNEIPLKERTENAIERYKQTVYGIALTQLKYRSDADDVFQEVFLLYFDKDITFNDEEHEKAWLIRTTVNLCKKSNYSPWRTRTVPLEEAENKEDIFACASEEENRVFDELRGLKPKYKIPIYLFYFENMPVKEVARIIGISETAARKRLSRGRAMLRERLECDYFE